MKSIVKNRREEEFHVASVNSMLLHFVSFVKLRVERDPPEGDDMQRHRIEKPYGNG